MSSMSFNDLMKRAKDAGGFELIPIGNYVAKVSDAKAQATSNGKDMIAATFEIISGPNAKSKVFTNFVISPENPNAVAFFFRHMKALGLDSDFFSAEPSMEQVAAAIKDRICGIKVGQHEYRGETRNDVKGVMPAPPEYANGQAAIAAPPADPFRQAASAGAAQSAASAPAPQMAESAPAMVQQPVAPAADMPPPPF